MHTLKLNVPQEVEAALKAAGYTPQELSAEARRSLAATLYHRKVLTLEQAARLAQLPLWQFLPLLGELGLPVADYDKEEVQKELEAARWLAAESQRAPKRRGLSS